MTRRPRCYTPRTMPPRGASPALLASFILLLAGAAHAQDAPDQSVPVPSDDEYADTDPSALGEFEPALEPYGTWTDDPSFGTVWSPDPTQVGSDFQPYDTNGSWDYVDSDPVWVSGYTWGWICFHYGRWAWSRGHWIWVPGRDYAGAWVSWLVGDDQTGYVGWAPMGPTWGWFGGSATTLGMAPTEPWLFVAYGDFLAADVGSHAVHGSGAAALAGHMRQFVRSTPSVAGAPVPHGPPAAVLGVDAAHASVALPPRERRARQLARPSTAVALGARAPAAHVVRATPRPGPGMRFGGAAPARGAVSRGRR